MLVGYITVREHTLVRLQFLDQLGQVLLRIDRNSVGIQLAGQLGMILPPGNVRDLRGSEGNYIKSLVVSLVAVEVVEIPPGCSYDDHISFL